MKTKKARLEEDITNLIQQADRLCEEAEDKGTITLLSQANALRARAKLKKSSVATLQEELDKEMECLKETE